MAELILEGSATGDWRRLVHEAAEAATRELDETLESYLVMLLSRALRDVEAVHKVMAIEYLEALLAGGSLGSTRLRDVGDHCLLVSGLFPHRAQRRQVKVSYFVELGRSAYQELSGRLSRSTARLYHDLAAAFVGLMEVLQAMRELGGGPGLDALQAVELWQDTGSPRALRSLRRYTGALPAAGPARRH